MLRSSVAWVLGSVAMAALGCDPPRTTTRPENNLPVLHDAGRRPNLPDLRVSFDQGPRECFPPGFRATRVRQRGDAVELCGLTVGGTPRCYRVDALNNTVQRVQVADAPTQPVESPIIEPPLRTTELASRGARANTRGGSFTVINPGGGTRTAAARGLGFESLENAVLSPWSDGWFIALIGVRGRDLGASAIVDPSRQSMIGHSAILPCDAGD